MDAEESKGSGRIRARLDGYVDPLTRRVVFRVEDQSGRVLGRIREARNPQEALALYWRCAGASMPGATMSKDLDRRIGRARMGGAGDQELRTPELPFDTTAPTSVGEPDDAERQPGLPAAQARRSRSKRAVAPVPQTDLFAPDPGVPDLSAGHGDEIPEAAAVEPPLEPPLEPEQAPDTPPVEPAIEASLSPPAPPPDPEPRILMADAVMLQRVDPRQLRPTDRADSYLYHITNGSDAEVALRQGLVVSASDPMILTERQGVSYWLSVLAEDYDYIMDGPADFVVLRLRRLAVEELLEPDPHATRSAGCPCYLLTGRHQAN